MVAEADGSSGKKAYDAIDIEYAQLYEKHNALEAQQKAS